MTQLNCCRTCLCTTSLNPILQIANRNTDYMTVLMAITGVKIDINDSLPHVMCIECINFINKCLDFRNKCQISQRILLKRKHNKYCEAKLENSGHNDHRGVKVDINKFTEDLNTNSNEFNNEDEFRDKEINDFNDTDAADDENDGTNNLFIEYETKVEDLLKKPMDIIFQNKKRHNRVKLNYVETDIIEDVIKDNKIREKDKRKNRGLEVRNRDVDHPLECKYCHKILKSEVSLNNHYKIHTALNVICEHCGKKFMNKCRLLMHCKAKHGYEKTDKCLYCDYRGCSAELVKIHERTHTGEKPYVCGACGARFHRRSTYLQHVPIHLPYKTVQCDECPALFKSVTLMRIHKSRHTRQKRSFSCNVCRSAFSTRRDCARHATQAHDSPSTVVRLSQREL